MSLAALSARLAALCAFVLGLAAILGALAFQYVGGLYPCELCLVQRWPYYVGLPALALVLLLWKKLTAPVKGALMAGAAALFGWGALMGVYHAGVEWDWFEGPQACSGVGDAAISLDSLLDLSNAQVVACDAIQWEAFGVSLAGFNALISAAITVLLVAGIVRLWRENRGQGSSSISQ